MPFTAFTAPRAVAEIDGAALFENFRLLRAHCGGRTVAVVKANAYGHGLALAVPTLLRAGCDFFAVATLDEALEVRALTRQADILILGYTPPPAAAVLEAARLTQTVFSAEYAAALSAAARARGARVAVHIKIDTGMCRLGLPVDGEAVGTVLAQENLAVLGAFTHFPSADTDPTQTLGALREFLRLREVLPKGCFLHAAASAAALSLPESRLDGTRMGIALYGYPPVRTMLSLQPVLRLFCPVVQIRAVESGTPVGYGGSFVTARPSRIGVLPVGYADGLTRALRGLTVRVFCQNGVYHAPLVGQICMDQCMVDLTDTPARVGDTVCPLFDLPAAAARAGSIPYEILTAISTRVERRMKGAL